MKIEKIFIENIGPFNKIILDFKDEWSGELSPRILFSGPNGSGKSTILNCISDLWKALGYWLFEKKELPKNHEIKKKFSSGATCALLLDEVPDFSVKNGDPKKKVLVFLGEKHAIDDIIESENTIDCFLGELSTNGRKTVYEFLVSQSPGIATKKSTEAGYQNKFFLNWSEEYKKLILSGNKTLTPNMVYLDAEERRWIKAEKHIGKPVQESLKKRWLYTYQASREWEHQLEASLITLKTTSLHKFHEIVRLLNSFLVGKEILPDIQAGENRLRINIKNKRNTWHSFDELSAGEREAFVLVYSVGRWLEDAGIALIDEPDIFLHPGIMPDAYSSIERIVEEKGGQLIVTSHFPEMWERYENRGKRIKLGPGVG